MIAELPRRINSWSVPVSHCSFICCCFFYFTQILRAVQNFKRQRGAILIGDRSISKKEKGPWEGSTKNETCVACGCFFCPSQGALSASKIRSQAHSALHPRMVTKRVEPSKGFVSLMVAKFLDLNKKWSCNRCKYGRRKTKKIDTYDSSRAL